MRKAFIGLGVLVLLLLIAGIAVSRVDVNRYRPEIEAKLKEKLGRDISLGQMSLSFVPLAFRVDDAVIADDPDFGGGMPFAQVHTLFVRPGLLPLLRHEVRIDSLQLDHPKLELIHNQKGIWNFASLGTHKDGNSGKFALDELKIFDGQVALTDLQLRQPRAVYDHIDLVLRDFAPEKSFSFEARAHLPGAGQEALVLKGDAGPIQREALAATAFQGNLELNGVSLAGLQRFAHTDALADSEALLTGTAEFKNSGGVLTSSGKLDARNARIHGVDMNYPISADYGITANMNDSTTQIHKANLKLGATPIALEGTIHSQGDPSMVDLKAHASDVSMAEAARLAAAFGVAFNAKMDVQGKMNLNVHAQGASNKPTLDGQMSMRDVHISGGELREPVQADMIEVALAPDSIRSNDFTIKTGRTSVAAQFTLSQYGSSNPHVDARFNTQDADVDELLKIANAYGVSAVDGMKGGGTITLNLTANGPIHQSEAMTFSGTGTLRNATLHMPSLTKPLEIPKADLRFNANSVALDNLAVSLGQTSATGNLTLRNFSAPRVEFSLAANKLNVAEWEAMTKAQEKPAGTVQRQSAEQSGILSHVSGSGQLTVGTLEYDKLVLNDVRSNVTVDRGVIALKPFSSTLYNGRQTGAITVNTLTQPPTYMVDTKLQSVDANQLLSSISSMNDTLYGLLAAAADAHFTVAGGNAANISRSLNGKFSLNLKDGKLAHADLLQQLATIAQFQRTARAVEPFTKLIQLGGDFDVNNGVAHTSNLKAGIEGGSLAAEGSIDLAQQKLDMRLTAVLSQEFSQLVGGNNIGGFMQTALANRQGELVIPVLVTGTLREPHFAPDIQKIAKMKLENLLPNSSDPSKLTSDVLGEILRGKPDEQSPSRKPEDTLRNILGGVLGKKKQEQQPQNPKP